MRTDEGTGGKTDKTEGYTDSHADGRKDTLQENRLFSRLCESA
jgi:hypothetical protein